VHAQVYVEFDDAVRIGTVIKLHRGHWEARKGSRDAARDYCRKQDTRLDDGAAGPFEYGDWVEKAQGKRSDLSACKAILDEGGTLEDIAREHFSTFVRYERGLRSYQLLIADRRKHKSEVYLFFGPPGTGKTVFAIECAGDDNFYIKTTGKWWDGYNGQSDVILDEFRGNLPYQTLLQILDASPIVVETKGGSLNFNPVNIFITTNRHPKDWYSPDVVGNDLGALMRRIDNWIYFDYDFKRTQFPGPKALWNHWHRLGYPSHANPATMNKDDDEDYLI
jgi:hypothetical protein